MGRKKRKYLNCNKRIVNNFCNSNTSGVFFTSCSVLCSIFNLLSLQFLQCSFFPGNTNCIIHNIIKPKIRYPATSYRNIKVRFPFFLKLVQNFPLVSFKSHGTDFICVISCLKYRTCQNSQYIG